MRMTIVAIASCLSLTAAAAQDTSAVRQASQKFTSALAGGDVAAAAGMFTDDALVLPPGRKEIKGRTGIQAFFSLMTGAVQNLRYASEDVQAIGESAAREIGTVSFTQKARKGGSPQDVSGKYLLVWVKSGSDWKVSVDMWNRSSGLDGSGKTRRGSTGGMAPLLDEQ